MTDKNNQFDEKLFENYILNLLHEKSLEIDTKLRNEITSKEIKIGETLDKLDSNFDKNKEKISFQKGVLEKIKSETLIKFYLIQERRIVSSDDDGTDTVLHKDIVVSINFFPADVINHFEYEKMESALNIKRDLTLDKHGNLSYGKDKTYPIGQNAKRHKIILFLVKNEGYQETASISNDAGSKTVQSTRIEIGRIRKGIYKYLGIDEKLIIENKPYSGYRINPDYKIKLIS